MTIAQQERGPTITAMLDDGPLQGIRIEAQVVQGRKIGRASCRERV